MWLLVAAALAQEPSRDADLGLGWFDMERGRPEVAAERAVRWLRADPTDVGAHRLYIGARAELDGGSTAITRQYRTWYEAEPTDEVRRAAWALALVSAHKKTGSWCTELAAALEPPMTQPGPSYWALRAAIEAHDGRCPGDPARDAAALTALTPVSPEAAEYAVYLRIRNEAVDPALGAQLAAIIRRAPWRLRWARHLWRDGATGEGLEAARTEALIAARAALASADAAALHGASEVFKAAGLRPEEAQARAASLELQPAVTTTRPAQDALVGEVRKARRLGDPATALSQLEALAARVPDSSAARTELEMERAERLGTLARGDEALVARRRAWLSEAERADPGSEQLRPAAAGFALAAALAGQHLSEARLALDTALAALDSAAWQDSSSLSGAWSAWADQHAQARAELITLRGWLSWRMGETEAARADLWRALELYRLPRAHLLLGLVAADLDAPRLAEQQLAFGLALATPKEARSLLADARSALDGLWKDGRHWHAGGLDGYLAEVGRAEAEPSATTPAEPVGEAHPLIGQKFPIELYTQGGAQKRLADHSGIVVVDLWATWCGPCLQSLPHLEDVTRQYAGRVTVLALSVDQDAAKVGTFWASRPPPSFQVGWVGPGAQRMVAASGIPAQFVLDAEHRVVAYFKGFRSGVDDRLTTQLDAMLPR